jgi:hypothetical protein
VPITKHSVTGLFVRANGMKHSQDGDLENFGARGVESRSGRLVHCNLSEAQTKFLKVAFLRTFLFLSSAIKILTHRGSFENLRNSQTERKKPNLLKPNIHQSRRPIDFPKEPPLFRIFFVSYDRLL